MFWYTRGTLYIHYSVYQCDHAKQKIEFTHINSLYTDISIFRFTKHSALRSINISILEHNQMTILDFC